MGLFGLVLAVVYALVVTEQRLKPVEDAAADPESRTRIRRHLPKLFSSVSVVCAYVGSGLQFAVCAALIAWLPSYFNRYYHMASARAGATAGVFALVIGIGMIGAGVLSDRLDRIAPARKWTVAMGCCLASMVLLVGAFRLPNGGPQLLLLALGSLLSAGTAGPAAAMVANLTPTAISATAFATLTLANSLLGLAPGPAVTGMLADHLGLKSALAVLPLISLPATVAFLIGRHYFNLRLVAALQRDSATTRLDYL
jgi:MFS family permease